MRIWSLFFLLSVVGPLSAHEGHDHGDAPQPEAGSIAPRFEARSDVFDVVGVLRGSDFLIYVDRAASNQPVLEAAIELESGKHKVAIKATRAGPEGAFRLPAGALAAVGEYPLTLTVEAGDAADLLSSRFLHVAVTEVKTPGAATGKGSGTPLYVAVAATVLAGLAAWWGLGRRG